MVKDKVPAGGIGPGYFFAQALHEESGVPIGLLPFAIGAALSDWAPEQPNKGRYGFVKRHMKKIGGRAKGVLWYQGEQDAILVTVPIPSLIKPISTCASEFKKFVEAVRRDCHNPKMPVILAQVHGHYFPPFYAAGGYVDQHKNQKAISGNLLRGRGWEKIREIQRRLPESIPFVHTVPTIDLGLANGLRGDSLRSQDGATTDRNQIAVRTVDFGVANPCAIQRRCGEVVGVREAGGFLVVQQANRVRRALDFQDRVRFSASQYRLAAGQRSGPPRPDATLLCHRVCAVRQCQGRQRDATPGLWAGCDRSVACSATVCRPCRWWYRFALQRACAMRAR